MWELPFDSVPTRSTVIRDGSIPESIEDSPAALDDLAYIVLFPKVARQLISNERDGFARRDQVRRRSSQVALDRSQ
jgi:hypothetical protein